MARASLKKAKLGPKDCGSGEPHGKQKQKKTFWIIAPAQINDKIYTLYRKKIHDNICFLSNWREICEHFFAENPFRIVESRSSPTHDWRSWTSHRAWVGESGENRSRHHRLELKKRHPFKLRRRRGNRFNSFLSFSLLCANDVVVVARKKCGLDVEASFSCAKKMRLVLNCHFSKGYWINQYLKNWDSSQWLLYFLSNFIPAVFCLRRRRRRRGGNWGVTIVIPRFPNLRPNNIYYRRWRKAKPRRHFFSLYSYNTFPGSFSDGKQQQCRY